MRIHTEYPAGYLPLSQRAPPPYAPYDPMNIDVSHSQPVIRRSVLPAGLLVSHQAAQEPPICYRCYSAFSCCRFQLPFNYKKTPFNFLNLSAVGVLWAGVTLCLAFLNTYALLSNSWIISEAPNSLSNMHVVTIDDGTESQHNKLGLFSNDALNTNSELLRGLARTHAPYVMQIHSPENEETTTTMPLKMHRSFESRMKFYDDGTINPKLVNRKNKNEIYNTDIYIFKKNNNQSYVHVSPQIKEKNHHKISLIQKISQLKLNSILNNSMTQEENVRSTRRVKHNSYLKNYPNFVPSNRNNRNITKILEKYAKITKKLKMSIAQMEKIYEKNQTASNSAQIHVNPNEVNIQMSSNTTEKSLLHIPHYSNKSFSPPPMTTFGLLGYCILHRPPFSSPNDNKKSNHHPIKKINTMPNSTNTDDFMPSLMYRKPRCHPYGGHLDVFLIPSSAWQASTLLCGTASAMLSISAVLAIFTACKPHICKSPTAWFAGYLQLVVVIIHTSGLLLFPLGLGSDFAQHVCGRSAGPYDLGEHCTFGWGYVIAILGGATAAFLPYLSKFALKGSYGNERVNTNLLPHFSSHHHHHHHHDYMRRSQHHVTSNAKVRSLYRNALTAWGSFT